MDIVPEPPSQRLATPPAPPAPPAPRRRGVRAIRGLALRLAIVAVFFAAVAPTLRWLEFFHAEENVVVAQALEMRRTGNWLIPTLQGRQRTIKPPLTVWITAAAIRPRTLARLDDPEPATRAAAYRDLAFETRWPTVLCAGLMLVAVFELGRAIARSRDGDSATRGGATESDAGADAAENMPGSGDGDGGAAAGAGADALPFGLLCACVCGTTWYFLIRQGSKNTVDLQLALWVSVANACLAWGVLRGRWWTACLGGGVALGLATMSKGPAVPLLQSVVPVVAYAIYRRHARSSTSTLDVRCSTSDVVSSDSMIGAAPEGAATAITPNIQHRASNVEPGADRAAPPLAAILLGAALMLIVGLWWYVVAYLNSPHIFPVWWAELTRRGANDLRDPPTHYLRALRLLFPWLAFFVVGVAAGIVLLVQRRHERWLLAFFLAVLPLLVMNCFKERKERYLIPLIGPMAVIAAHAVRSCGRRSCGRQSRGRQSRGRQSRGWQCCRPQDSCGRRLRSPQDCGGEPWEPWERVVVPLHWLGLAALAIGLPIAGAVRWEQMRTLAGGPWFPRPLVIGTLLVMGAILAIGAVLYRRDRRALVWSTVLIMLAAQLLYNYGFCRDPAGTSDVRPFAEAIRARWPAADLYASYGGDRPGIVFTPGVELAIYTNRSVPAVTDLAALPLAADRPTVVLVQSRRRQTEPAAPPGWRETRRQVLDNGDVLKLFVHE